jgi:hypothetical protein
MMRLLLTRTNLAAQVNDLPVTIWLAREADFYSDARGEAYMAEIVAIPATNRERLADELRGPYPAITVEPTRTIVKSGNAHARMWTGRSQGGLEIACFICVVQPSTKAMETLLEQQLLSMATVKMEIDNDVPTELPVNPLGALR